MEDVLTYVNEMMQNSVQAAGIFSQMDQDHVDRIVRAVYKAGFDNRIKFAHMAYEETGLGVAEHKVIKNVIATQFVYDDIKNEKTVGIISDDPLSGIVEIAQPLGPILAVVPVTNPTSTVMFKILIALKSRNPIIISAHRGAINCCKETARICYEAALSEDAPEDCIQWTEKPSREQTHALMSHEKLALILATGGGSLVNAAYSSGTPAIGVGAGNVPVLIDKTADIPFAVENVIMSKTFDNGTICASEQAIVAEKSVSEQVKEEFIKQGCYLLKPDEIEKLENVAFDKKRNIMSAAVVGRPVKSIARMAGIDVPENTKILIAEQDGVGENNPLSSEILAPILAYYTAEDFDDAVNICIDLNYHGGIGHTASIFSNDNDRIKEFSNIINAGRIVVNMPSSQGAVGGLFNTLSASLTLGCGTGGKNITTDNITARHLLNIQRITRRKVNQNWINFDTAKYFDESLTTELMEKEFYKNS